MSNNPILLENQIEVFNTNTKDQTRKNLSEAQFKNYVNGLEGKQREFVSLLDSTLRNTYNWTAEQENTKAMFLEEERAKKFLDRFSPKEFNETLDLAAKEAGFTTDEGRLYFDSEGNLNKGYMGYFEASDAGSMYSGDFELMSTNAAALRRKTQMYSSTNLLYSSKNAEKIKPLINISDEDRQYIDEQTRVGNNWSRFVNIDSGTSAAAAIPIVDPLYTILASQTPDERLLSKKDPTFDGSKLVDAMLEDREHVAFLVSQGVNLDLLKTAQNPFHFLFLLNSPVQANAINRTMKTAEAYHSTTAEWALFGVDQVRSSLGSGDFVGQVALTVATAGLGTAVAGSATALNMLQAGSRAKSAVKMSETAVRMAKAGQAINNVRDYLPANIPSTVMRKLSPKGLVESSNKWVVGGSWFTGQAIEGFLEEGITDVFNQAYELSHGTRLNYNYDQTFQAALMGALMEPVLGGALTTATIPVNVTAIYGKKLGTAVSNRIFSVTFNIPPTRFKEVGLYFDSFMGRFNKLSPEDQQIRISTITNSLVIESALNEATNNQFGKIEDNINLLGKVIQVLGEDNLIKTSDVALETLSSFSLRLLEYRNRLISDAKLVETDKGPMLVLNDIEIPYTKELQNLVDFTDGTVKFSSEGLGLLLTAFVADSQGLGKSRESNITDIISFLATQKLEKEIKESNPDASSDDVTELVFEDMANEESGRYSEIVRTMSSLFDMVGSLYQADQVIEENVIEEIDPDQESANALAQSQQQLRSEIQSEQNKEESSLIGDLVKEQKKPKEETYLSDKIISRLDPSVDVNAVRKTKAELEKRWIGINFKESTAYINGEYNREAATKETQFPKQLENEFKDLGVSVRGEFLISPNTTLDSPDITTETLEQALKDIEKEIAFDPEVTTFFVRYVTVGVIDNKPNFSLIIQETTENDIKTELNNRKAKENKEKPEVPTTKVVDSEESLKAKLESLSPELRHKLKNTPPC